VNARDAVRFWAKVDKDGPGGCWLWISPFSPNGYGRFTVGGRSASPGYAHRMSWLLAGRSLTPRMVICHKCDVRACVNPEHLFEGTRKDNSEDMKAKGRSPRGEQRPNAKLTYEDVLKVRDRYAAGEKQRLLAAAFGVSQQTISDAVRGVLWDHVPV
jgi:hypothetical protein